MVYMVYNKINDVFSCNKNDPFSCNNAPTGGLGSVVVPSGDAPYCTPRYNWYVPENAKLYGITQPSHFHKMIAEL